MNITKIQRQLNYFIFIALSFFLLPSFACTGINLRAKDGNVIHPEYTMITTVKDTSALKYYYKTFQDQTIRMINFEEIDKNATKLKTIEMNQSQTIIDMSKL